MAVAVIAGSPGGAVTTATAATATASAGRTTLAMLTGFCGFVSLGTVILSATNAIHTPSAVGVTVLAEAVVALLGAVVH